MKQILIVEDVAETRHWLAGVVRIAFSECTIQEAATVDAARELWNRTVFDLALIDLGLPDGSGLDVLRSLREVSPSTLCVITTVVGDNSHIISALSAGAQGYLLKQQPADQLSRQLVQLHEGIPALSPSIARRIMEHFRMTGPVEDDDSGLSEREKQTLSLIARGFRNADVAENLGIAESTVASHIKSIYRKLGISTRAEASWHATRLGL
ncbi:MAG: response regulator transcription factor [Akkermansiaceae bacterium]|nr:response regulator transcription factor [Akkermansiaceae bacterium]